MYKNYNKQFILYLILLFACGIFFLYHKHPVSNDSTISEWFINYEGGFTKRGLIGQISIFITSIFDLNLRFVIFLFQSTIFLIYFTLIFLFFKNIEVNKVMLLAIFTPIFILYPIAEIEILARKELFIFSFFLIYLLNKNNKIKNNLILFGLPVCVLIWEPVVFFFPFILAIEIINHETKNFREILFKRSLIFIPSLIVALYIIFNPLSDQNHELMASYLKDNFNEKCYMACRLLNTKSTLYQQFNPSEVYNFEIIIRYFLIIAIGFGPLFFLSYQSKLNVNNLFLFGKFNNLFFPILILLLPVVLLFLMGSDWGRWVNISYVFVCFFYFYLYKNKLITINDDYKFLRKKILDKNNIFIFIFIIFCFGWNPKTSITGDVGSFPGYRIPLKIINKIFTNQY